MVYITYDGCYHSHAFRDNHQQSNIPESKLMKCWNALAFHCVREAVASGFLHLYHIPGNKNPTGLLTKFLGYEEAIPYLSPLTILALLPVVCSRRLLLCCRASFVVSSSTCHCPSLLVAITVYCCFALFRVVSRCFALLFLFLSMWLLCS